MVLCPAVLVERGVGTSYMIPIEKGGRYFIYVPTKRVCGGCFVSRKTQNLILYLPHYKAFSNDVMAAILVRQRQ